jgi:hypothetical protein
MKYVYKIPATPSNTPSVLPDMSGNESYSWDFATSPGTAIFTTTQEHPELNAIDEVEEDVIDEEDIAEPEVVKKPKKGKKNGN